LVRGYAFEEGFHFLVLHGVLQRAHEDTLVCSGANGDGFCECGCRGEEFILDVFVHIQALYG
jgi:hypothetical protein